MNLYRMETIELYQYICENEKRISELKLIKILSLKTLRKVQDENLIILERSEYI